MKLLIKRATIVDPSSQYNGKIKDILIYDGRFVAFEDSFEYNVELSEVKILQFDNLYVSQGWVDLKSHFCDPGNEHKETIFSGLNAALCGGFTHVGLLPSTNPTIDGKTQVEYILKKNENHITRLHPIGAITKGCKGEVMTEMYDMYRAGVHLFSDDTQYISPEMLLKTLLYIKNFGGNISIFSRNKEISKYGVVNEGIASIYTGLNADPNISEVIEVERNIRLLEYTESKLHLTGISCAESIELIRKAKLSGLSITADVHLANLIYTEEKVLNFDTNFKFLPVLRTEDDRQALWSAIKDGTIDAIVSDHRPNNREDKYVEFDKAAFGTIQLQTFFGNLCSCKEFELNPIITALSHKARKIINIQQQPIEINNYADLTLFSPTQKWTFQHNDIVSKSKETSNVGQEFIGCVVGVINNGQYHTNYNITNS